MARPNTRFSLAPASGKMIPMRFFAVSCVVVLLAGVQASYDGEPKTALLFAYFRTESEALHYAVSRDGLHWVPLANNEPVMFASVGAQSVRRVGLLRPTFRAPVELRLQEAYSSASAFSWTPAETHS